MLCQAVVKHRHQVSGDDAEFPSLKAHWGKAWLTCCAALRRSWAPGILWPNTSMILWAGTQEGQKPAPLVARNAFTPCGKGALAPFPQSTKKFWWMNTSNVANCCQKRCVFVSEGVYSTSALCQGAQFTEWAGFVGSSCLSSELRER